MKILTFIIILILIYKLLDYLFIKMIDEIDRKIDNTDE